MNSGPTGKEKLPDYLPVRMLNEFVYCPRLFYLEWVQGEFKDSADTVKGRNIHQKVDGESGELTSGTGEEKNIHATSTLLSSDTHKIIAKLDLIEGTGNAAIPVDYKKGKKPDIEGEAWPQDKGQICAQALILRDNGFECSEGIIYYHGSRTRVGVPITSELVSMTSEAIKSSRELAESGQIPPPLQGSPKCDGCSLSGICLPDEINNLVNGAENIKTETRRLYPARDDSIPVYVRKPGAKIGKQGENLTVKYRGKPIASSRMIETSQICIYGNVQISTQALRECCTHNIPICYFSGGGWFYGMTNGMGHKNVELRLKQYGVANDKRRSVLLAKRFIEGKMRNCRTLLRRNAENIPPAALSELSYWIEQAAKTHSLRSLLGIEGSAARIYFLHFSKMLKQGDGGIEFDLHSRNRRPPRDPINAMLSYAYAVLAKDIAITLLSVGFDPYLGFYHQPRYGRPSLALDIMEEFRPLVVDSVVISLINNGEIKKDDFVQRGDAVSLTSSGKKTLLRGYERRMNDLITHPTFGYTISYRRIIEVQCRLISRYLFGEMDEYPIFCTR